MFKIIIRKFNIVVPMLTTKIRWLSEHSKLSPIWQEQCCCMLQHIGSMGLILLCGPWRSNTPLMYIIYYQDLIISLQVIYTLVQLYQDINYEICMYGDARSMYSTHHCNLVIKFPDGSPNLNWAYSVV